MPRLINADALADRLDALAYDDWNQGVSVSWADAFKVFAEMVRDEAEAEPVRSGRWIKMRDRDGVYWACSECGEDIPRIAIYDPRYSTMRLITIDKTKSCPNCGAKMSEVEDG